MAEDGVVKHVGIGNQKIAEDSVVVTIEGQHGVPLHRKVIAGQPIPPELIEAYEAQAKPLPKATPKPKPAAD